MALVNFTNLDFDLVRSSIKEYLRANSSFTDYDFEGSNLSTIIDVLAYNTYITSYNANMISNEVFIDSATLRENVVSLARNVGYVPRSRTGARARINFFVNTSNLTTNPVTLTLQKGIVCSSPRGTSSYTFCINEDITVPVVDNIAIFNDIEVCEGYYINENFLVNSRNVNQRFILSNPSIDTSTIRVSVRNNQTSSTIRKFTLADNLFNVDSNSKIFFIQEVEDQRYELLFGDGIFGEKLDNFNFIEVNYIITNGESANGITQFTFNGRIIDNNGRIVTSFISPITTNSASSNGQEIEDVNSIKRNSTKLFASQNRAVTASDYEVLIPKIYPEAEFVSVFGGETLNPPRYGKVYISIKPKDGLFVSSQVKENLKRSLRKYSVAGIITEILDLKFLYIETNSTVYYNSNKVSSANDLSTKILKNILSYSNSSELNKYGARFKYSKFLKIIDDSDESITSNITRIQIRRDLLVSANLFASYEICFGNEFHVNNMEGFNIKSSGFKVGGISGTVYLTDIPINETTGKLVLFKINENNNYVVVRSNVGNIDYKKGEIMLSPINIIDTTKSYGKDYIIEISATPKSNDIIGLQDLYLQLDVNQTIVNTVSDTITSGSDISGSTYSTTSSYTSGQLIRS
jgi:hypothetical protein